MRIDGLSPEAIGDAVGKYLRNNKGYESNFGKILGWLTAVTDFVKKILNDIQDGRLSEVEGRALLGNIGEVDLVTLKKNYYAKHSIVHRSHVTRRHHFEQRRSYCH